MLFISLLHINWQETRVAINSKVFKPSSIAIWNRYKTKYSKNGQLVDELEEVEQAANP
jgi:hypothetical protein